MVPRRILVRHFVLVSLSLLAGHLLPSSGVSLEQLRADLSMAALYVPRGQLTARVHSHSIMLLPPTLVQLLVQQYGFRAWVLAFFGMSPYVS